MKEATKRKSKSNLLVVLVIIKYFEISSSLIDEAVVDETKAELNARSGSSIL